MSDHVQQLKLRLTDTRVSGTRRASSGEAGRAAAELEATLKAENPRAVAGDAQVSVLRWKDTEAICTLYLQVTVRTDAIDVEQATERAAAVFRRVQRGAFR